MNAQGTKTTQCFNSDDLTTQWSSAFTMLLQTEDFPHSEDSRLQDINVPALLWWTPIGERRRRIILKMEKQIKELINIQKTKSFNHRDSWKSYLIFIRVKLSRHCFGKDQKERRFQIVTLLLPFLSMKVKIQCANYYLKYCARRRWKQAISTNKQA